MQRDKLTTLMITHNMRDAIAHGNRLIMLYDGRIVVDIAGEEKKKLTVEQLLALFSKASGSDEADDKLLVAAGFPIADGAAPAPCKRFAGGKTLPRAEFTSARAG